jgi:hypothetical protein
MMFPPIDYNERTFLYWSDFFLCVNVMQSGRLHVHFFFGNFNAGIPHMFYSQIALKMADLGHLCDPTPIHLQWVQRLEEEFFMQGDAEQAAGIPITPLFDRTKPGVTKSQVAFMDIVALPLYKAMTQFCPDTEPFLEGVSEGCFALLVQQQ